MSDTQLFLILIAAAFATYATRVLPYLFFANKKPGPLLLYLEKNIPAAIMVILIFYSLGSVQWSQTYGWRELLSIAVAAGVYLKTQNALLGIALPTALYMGLVQLL